MIEPSLSNETERLAALYRYEVLDTTPEEVYDRLTALTARLFETPVAYISLIDCDRTWIKSHYGSRITRINRKNAFSQQVLNSQKLLIVNDLKLDPVYATYPSVTGEPYFRFYAGAPLRTPDGFIIGALSVLDIKPRAFTAEQQASLEDLATIVMNQLELRLSRRKLTRSEELYRTLAHNYPRGAVFLFDKDLRFLVAEGESLLASGFSEESVEGKTIWEVLPAERAQALSVPYRAALDGHNSFFELKAQDKIYSTHVLPVKNKQAEIVAGMVVSQDITERVQIEEELRESQERLSSIIGTIADGITIVDREGQLTFANPAAEELLSLTHDKLNKVLYNDPLWKITDIEGNPFPDEQLPFAQVMRTGKAVYNVEHAIEYPPGNWRILSINAAPLHNRDNKITGVVSTLRDITEQKWAEVERIQLLKREKLARTEAEAAREQIINTLESITDGFFALDRAGHLTYMNRNAEALININRTVLLGHNIWEVFPDALSLAFYAEAQKALAQNTVTQFEAYYEPLDKWMECTCYPGKEGLSTYVRDITARKQTEKALQESQERFKSAFQFSAIGMTLVDMDGRYLQVNQAMCRMVGYTEEELLQSDFQAITHPADLNKDIEHIQRLLADEAHFYEIEKRYLHKNDTVIWVHLTRSLVRDSQGQPAYYISQAQNITERKKAEQDLRESEERFRTLSSASFEGLVIHDGKRIIESNQTNAEMLGYTLEEMAGKPLLDLVAPEDRARMTRSLDTASPRPAEFTAIRKDGSTLTLEVRGRVVEYRGRQVAIMAGRDVTELRRAELELRESEERYRFLSNATLEGVVAIQDGLVEEANQSAAQIYGYAKPEEIIGKTYSKLVAPEYLPEVQQLVAENYDKPYETLLVRKDGSYFPAEIQGKTLEYHGQLLRVGTVRDITERKKAEEALAAEQAQRENKSNLLRAVLNLLPVGVTIMNTEGQIVERNLADWTLWDENPYETVPVAQQPGYKAWWVSTGQPIGPEEWPAARALLKGEIALDEEIYIESFAGHKKTFLNSAVPIRDEAGVITNAVSVNVDITDRKHSEEALRNSEERYRQLNIQLEQRVTERTAQLEAANHELAGEINERVRLEEELREALKKERELSELKSRFVSMTSHEFRTPLSAILTNAELLRRYNHRWTEEKKVELFQRIETSTRHMTNMLDDILLIGKAESGKLEFNPMPLDITSFCQNMVEEFQLSSGSGYQLEFIQQGTASVAWLDEKLMRQIVGNLLSNAIKYSPPGSTVRFELNCEKNGVILKIKDQGIGIPPEDQARMFEVFHRAKNVGTIQGTGLGLTIVKRSVDLHSGTITVESEVKAGTTFTIWLPARKN